VLNIQVKWLLPIPVLSVGRVVEFEPITNRTYETLIKYVSASDENTDLFPLFRNLLSELCTDKTIDFEKVNILDILSILVRIRSICISPDVKLKIKLPTENEQGDIEDKESNLTLALPKLHQTIFENYCEPIEIDLDDGIHIEIHYPRNDKSLNVYDYVTGITVDNQKTNMSDLTSEQFDQLLEELPPRTTNKLLKAKKQIEQSYYKMIIVPSSMTKKKQISLFPDDLSHFLRLMFSENIHNFIEQMYVFVKFIKMSLSDVMELTPLDTQLYYKTFEREVEEKKKRNAQKESKSINV
jgi:hypothetical protein